MSKPYGKAYQRIVARVERRLNPHPRRGARCVSVTRDAQGRIVAASSVEVCP